MLVFVLTSILLFKTSFWESIDSSVHAFFIGSQNTFTTNFMSVLDIVTGEMIFAGLVILLSLIFFYKKTRRETLLLIFSVGTGGVAVKFLKDYFEVVRPNAVIGDVVSSFSFPSGHATLATLFFLVAGYLFYKGTENVLHKKIATWGSLLLVLLILLNRLYLGIHWFSDVFAGVFLGLGIALISLYIYIEE